MKKSNKVSDQAFVQEFERGMLRSAFVSAFWAVIQARKAETGLTLSQLADRLGINKSAVSRWFSGTKPNWEIDTISDLAIALEVDVEVVVVDRKMNRRFGPAGEIQPLTLGAGTTPSSGQHPILPGTDTVSAVSIRLEAA
ncbi:helix-turn-helix transcriptional regulator [Mesorhizobium sp. M0633]|uniref:helix-turn-helix domain-containing protein n=1 Tax=unclassified Mesorhizobium TaxID=325217 RepID=UPI00333961D5